MGGLVARDFIHGGPRDVLAALRGVALLGTPNRGTVTHGVLGMLLDWAEALAGPNPFARSFACRAALQLTAGDAEQFLASLNARASTVPPRMAVLSVSGGLNYLEFGGTDGFGNRVRNRLLQAAIAETPNDGLVAESSANVSHLLRAATHDNHHPDYRTINHTHLVRNQGIADVLVRWLDGMFR
jgi:hypothetical protein